MSDNSVPSNAVRVEHGWRIDGGYICDGCAVRPPYEHRCHHADDGPRCRCDLCSIECDARMCSATAWFDHAPGWYFGPPHPSDGIGEALCPVHAEEVV